MARKLTHIDEHGAAHMVDVGQKIATERQARAQGCIIMAQETLAAIEENRIAKGDVFAAARIAGIMAGKKTFELIPLCHPLMLTKLSIDITADKNLPGIKVIATAAVNGKTGVEMEALSAVSIACLTIYDMAKAIDKAMTITNIQLIEKTGGKSGDWQR